MAETTTFTVRVPVELKERLEKLGEATARSKSWLAADAIARYVEEQEWQIAQIREGLADHEAGRVAPHEKVEAWLKSWGTDHELPPPECE